MTTLLFLPFTTKLHSLIKPLHLSFNPITEYHILSVTSLPISPQGGSFEPMVGLEPTAYWLQISCTTIVLHWQKSEKIIQTVSITTLKNGWPTQIRTENATAKKLCVTVTP